MAATRLSEETPKPGDAAPRIAADASHLWTAAADALRPVAAAAAERGGRLALLSGGVGVVTLCEALSFSCSAVVALGGVKGSAAAESMDAAAQGSPGERRSPLLGKRQRPPERPTDGTDAADNETTCGGSSAADAAAAACAAADAFARDCLRVLGSVWVSEEALSCRFAAESRGTSASGAPPSLKEREEASPAPSVLPEQGLARQTLEALQRWRAAGGVGPTGKGDGDDVQQASSRATAAAVAALLTLAAGSSSAGGEPSYPRSRAAPGSRAAAGAQDDSGPSPLATLLNSEAFFSDSWERQPLLIAARQGSPQQQQCAVGAARPSSSSAAHDPAFEALLEAFGDDEALLGSLIPASAACPPLPCDDTDTVGSFIEAAWKARGARRLAVGAGSPPPACAHNLTAPCSHGKMEQRWETTQSFDEDQGRFRPNLPSTAC